MRFIVILVILAALVAGVVGWGNAAWDQPGPSASETVVMIKPRTPSHAVATLLEQRGVVKSGLLFEMDMRLRGMTGQLKAGEYAIPGGASMATVAGILVSGKAIQHKLTAAEGLTSDMIWKLVQKDPVLVGDAGNPAATAERAGDIAVLPRLFLRAVHIGADGGIAGEIGVDIQFRLSRPDTQLAPQPEGADAIDDAEIDRLGTPPRHRVHAGHRNAEHLAGGAGVDVLALQETFLQLRNIRDMRQQPQLDLRIIGADQHISGLGDEGAADAAAFLGPHRDVLQIGIGGG